MEDNILLKDAKAMFNGRMLSLPAIPEDTVFPPEMVRLLRQKHHKDSSLCFTVTRTRTSCVGYIPTHYARHVLVYMDSDCIGSVTVTEERGILVYTVASPKTEKDRPRKGKVGTKSFKTAVALLDTYLLPIGNMQRYALERERLEFRARQWRVEFSELCRSRDAQLGTLVSTVSQVRQVCAYLGAAPPELEKLEETLTKMELLGSLVRDNCTYVHIHNGVCEVMGKHEFHSKTYPVSTLPPELARKIGMLKVASPEVLIKGVGVKKSDNTFLITGEI